MILQIEELVKRYDVPPWWLRPLMRTASNESVDALRGVSLGVERGEVVGLLGPNGAGKTTLLKIASSLLEPTSGRAFVDGIDVTDRPRDVRRKLGLVLNDERGFYWRLDGRRNLEFFGILSGLPRERARERAAELLQRFDLTRPDKLLLGYSSGMRARLNLARALMADPMLLLLDEPTRSLDPAATADVGRLLRDLAAEGRAVFLATHRMDEAASVCDRVIVLIDGEVRHVGRVEEYDGARGLAELLQTQTPS